MDRIPADQRVLLDVYGTNHDPAAWEAPTRFDPDRFVDRAVDPHELVAQGGGNEVTGHRCVGEHLTIHVLQQVLAMLSRSFSWRLATHPTLPRGRLPTLPRDGVVLDRVRRRATA